jgi:hypothetical protein
MSVTMDDSIQRWTAKRKTALVLEIIQGKTTDAPRPSFQPLPSPQPPCCGFDDQ